MTEQQKQEIGFFVHRNYLHDLSVENPVGRIAAEDAPKLRLGLDGEVTATPLGAPDHHRVDIHLRLTAALEERVVFLAELTYRVEVELRGIPEPVAPQMLCADVPTAFFPAVQTILQQNGAYAGYPEMQVAPLDFRALFYRNQQQGMVAPAS